MAGSIFTQLTATPIEMNGAGSYSENFDSLPNGENTDWFDDSTLPGWYSNQTALLVDDGSSFSGGLRSYGADGSTDRALGSVASGSTDTVLYGVLLENTGAQPVEISWISYTGEQWRYGGSSNVNTLVFSNQVSSDPIMDPSLGTWSDIPDLDFLSPVTSGTAGELDGNDAANRQLLSATTQIIVQPGEFVMLRWSDINDPGSDQGIAIDDLTVEWVVSSGEDTVPPSIVSLTPANGAANVPIETVAQGETLSAMFNEPIAANPGNILIKRSADDVTVATIDTTSFDFAVSESEAFIFLPAPLQAGTGYYVEISDGLIEDLAGNNFAGTDSTTWNFMVAEAAEQPTVVINKYSNSGSDIADRVELLVVGDETVGSTLDMRGMIVKDFSSGMTNDSGGKYEFSADPLWEMVPVGTLITLSSGIETSPDVDASDFTLSLGLGDVQYFNDLGGSFNIATTEMVLIKAAGSGAEGTDGGIHALAGGSPGSRFINFTGAKLLADGTSGTNLGVIANNSTSSLSDYLGTDATGAVPLSEADFGIPNNGTNAAYIAALRGANPADGDGSAIVFNATPGSPFDGRRMFEDGVSGQTATVTLTAQIAGVTLTDITVEIPTEFGTPTGGTISISGPGASGASLSVSGQTITIGSASVTTDDALVVTVSGLSTPVPSLVTDNGQYPFVISTTDGTGALTPIASQPPAYVIIPIASIRDVDENGVALDLGSVVAVEGVVTEEDLGGGSSNFSGFIQDSTAGVNIFSPSINPGLIRGNRFAVLGSVVQFRGLTEVVPTDAADIVDLGPDTEPAPLVLTIPQLLADAETFEGSLVTVENLVRADGSTNPWTNGQTITLRDSGMNTLNIRIQAGSTAVPAGGDPVFPATITGVFGQFDTSSPLTGGYQLMPRDLNDIDEGQSGGYAQFAITNNLLEGPNGDDDMDGIPNIVEYALGLNPQSPDGSPGTFSGNLLSFSKSSTAVANGDVSYEIETSTNLVDWGPVTEDVNDGTTISYTLPASEPGGKLFARLVVTRN